MGRVTLGGATGSGILHRCTIAISRQKGEKHVEHDIYRCSAGRYDERMVGGAVSVEVDAFVGGDATTKPPGEMDRMRAPAFLAISMLEIRKSVGHQPRQAGRLIVKTGLRHNEKPA